MSGFFGYKLSEVAVLALLLLALIPISKAAAASNYLPLVAGLLTYAGLTTIRRLSLGMRVLVALLVAMILVPTPFRGRRMWEGFEDKKKEEEEEEGEEEGEKGEIETMEAKEEEKEDVPPMPEQIEKMADINSNKNSTPEDPEDDSPDAANIDALMAKHVGTPPKNKHVGTPTKYRLPSEKDDGEHHMDVGTTFMNAYKKLKPDQIKNLTNDTQKLIMVQKDLMANLNNLKPLVSDGKEIMKTFKSFFGSDPTSA
jgi:hypothetical protein